MKIYVKIKRDGIWGWFRVETVQRWELAQHFCECRICELARRQAHGCQEEEE